MVLKCTMFDNRSFFTLESLFMGTSTRSDNVELWNFLYDFSKSLNKLLKYHIACINTFVLIYIMLQYI